MLLRNFKETNVYKFADYVEYIDRCGQEIEYDYGLETVQVLDYSLRYGGYLEIQLNI